MGNSVGTMHLEWVKARFMKKVVRMQLAIQRCTCVLVRFEPRQAQADLCADVELLCWRPLAA